MWALLFLAAIPSLDQLKQMTARFAPAEIHADTASLPENERAVLGKLVEAAKVIDGLYLRQVWGQNPGLLIDLARDTSALGQARLHYFLINKGPWSRLDHDDPFIANVGTKPKGGGFYPFDATKAELDQFMTKTKANGFYTTVRRGSDGKLVSVPYNLEYQNELERAAALLTDAAKLTKQPTLARFLNTRAEAFMSNNYYASEVAWMELDSSIEPTIGPYEVYEDEYFNYKAAFEAFITLRDAKETDKLKKFSAQLQGIEDKLPIDAKYRNTKLAALSPISVVNVVFTAGDANKGVQTAAYNLPNDERVINEKGSKRVMLKNLQEAKFKQVLLPISNKALSSADRKNVSFDAFFTHILMHELMHGLGPHSVGKSTVRQELKETYSAIEEAKADISGLFALEVLGSELKTMYTTFLASSFRTLRFGTNEAHGKGMAIQMNYLLDKGGFKANADGTFSVDEAKMKEGVRGLTHDLMTLQAEGNYKKALDLIETQGKVRPEVQRLIDRLTDVPVDIEPRFSL